MKEDKNMSHKFDKNRSVDFNYHGIPMYYTGVINPRKR